MSLLHRFLASFGGNLEDEEDEVEDEEAEGWI
jgi:hypothetical protein